MGSLASQGKSFTIENTNTHIYNRQYSNGMALKAYHDPTAQYPENYTSSLFLYYNVSGNSFILQTSNPYSDTTTYYSTELWLTDNGEPLPAGMYIWKKLGSTTREESVYARDRCLVNGPCTATSFNPPSKEEVKKDFEELPSGLDIIRNIDIYKYRYKEEEDTKKHIGLVIGKDYKYSEEVTNNKNDGVDLYSFISVCCKAIQEQQKQIEELKKEIDNLKGGNK